MFLLAGESFFCVFGVFLAFCLLACVRVCLFFCLSIDRSIGVVGVSTLKELRRGDWIGLWYRVGR